jgi:hypothetical protein
MITRIRHKCCNPGFISLVIHSLLLLAVQMYLPEPAAASDSLDIDFDPRSRAISGQDLSFTVRISGDAQTVQVHVRSVGSQDMFTSYAMDSYDGTTFVGTVPFTRDPEFDWGTIEYYFSAVNRHGHSQETRRRLLRFIETPSITRPVVLKSDSLNENEWTRVIKGPPIYKNAWFWVGTIAAAGIAYLILKGDNGNGDEPLRWQSRPAFPPEGFSYGDQIDIAAAVTGGTGTYEWTVKITFPSLANRPKTIETSHEQSWSLNPLTLTMTETTSDKDILFWLILNQESGNLLLGQYKVEMTVRSGDDVLTHEASFNLNP